MKIRMTVPELVVVDDAEELARQMVGLFDACAREALRAGRPSCVAVQQGVPSLFFERLGAESELQPRAWQRIHLFWMDQCCGLANSENGTCGSATCRFISKIPTPAGNIHRICSECRSCEFAASAYEQTIRRFVRCGHNDVPKFDLMLLQMDSDGRLASLCPDTYAFYESKQLVWVTRFTGAGITQITMTHPLLHAAAHIAVIVSGYEKAVSLREVLSAEPDVIRYPVHALWPVLDKVTWLVDRAAARFLPPSIAAQMTGHVPRSTGRSMS